MDHIEAKFVEYFSKESCKSCASKEKAKDCLEFDECSAMEREYFYSGVNAASDTTSKECKF